MIAVDEGTALLYGTLLTQAVVVFGIVFQARNSRRARRVAESTNEAVNNVDKEGGEQTLINQVREHGKILRRHTKHHEWSAQVLQEVARQAGVRVPPLPADDEEAA